MIQGMAGLMSITGEPDEKSSDGPQKIGVALADILTGLYSTIAILGALQERHHSGQGQYIDMSLFDTVAASLANQASNYLVSGVAPGRLGNAHPNVVPYQTFATSDGFIIVAVGNDSQFRNLCQVLEMPGLARDPRYLSNATRVEHRVTLAESLQGVFLSRSMNDWLAALEQGGVPCGPINTIDRLFADPQAIARGIQLDLDGMPLVANPIRYSRSAMNYGRKPPKLGSDTEAVLKEELGLTDEMIAGLKERNIVG